MPRKKYRHDPENGGVKPVPDKVSFNYTVTPVHAVIQTDDGQGTVFDPFTDCALEKARKHGEQQAMNYLVHQIVCGALSVSDAQSIARKVRIAAVEAVPFETTWGEIEAWRMWKWDPWEEWLSSPHRETRWYPGKAVTADCKPSESDGGIFAHKRCEAVIEQELAIPSAFLPALGPGTVGWCIGTVLLWGDVVEHEHGYRAEHARIRKIHYVSSNASDAIRERIIRDHDWPDDAPGESAEGDRP